MFTLMYALKRRILAIGTPVRHFLDLIYIIFSESVKFSLARGKKK